jgi:hypothetical protein
MLNNYYNTNGGKIWRRDRENKDGYGTLLSSSTYWVLRDPKRKCVWKGELTHVSSLLFSFFFFFFLYSPFPTFPSPCPCSLCLGHELSLLE